MDSRGRTQPTMEWEAIWNRARADLVVALKSTNQDVFLWEHSVRIADNARRIAGLPVVQQAHPDEAAVLAAALYHDADWITRLEGGEIRREEMLVRPAPETHREQSALMMERSLAKLLPADTLARASEAIRTLHDREIATIEGQVVTEAENLDEFGLLCLWPIIRRGALDGKGVQAVLDTWRRRKEYRFWDARLADSFRFAPVRAVAKRRLEQLERVMAVLAEQQQGSDLHPDLTHSPHKQATESQLS